MCMRTRCSLLACPLALHKNSSSVAALTSPRRPLPQAARRPARRPRCACCGTCCCACCARCAREPHRRGGGAGAALQGPRLCARAGGERCLCGGGGRRAPQGGAPLAGKACGCTAHEGRAPLAGPSPAAVGCPRSCRFGVCCASCTARAALWTPPMCSFNSLLGCTWTQLCGILVHELFWGPCCRGAYCWPSAVWHEEALYPVTASSLTH